MGIKRDDPQPLGPRALNETDADADPVDLFERWFGDISAGYRANPLEAIGVTLSTVTPDHKPAARMVLLKDFTDAGFTFFTNYEGDKAQQLTANPHAALTFWWPTFERQVRISGTVAKIERAESEAHFATRPRESQLGAWASNQSEVIPNRDVLEQKMAMLAAQYEGRDVPCPPNWGGYRLAPDIIEFWQGRPGRLHDRLRYTRQLDQIWRIERLAP